MLVNGEVVGFVGLVEGDGDHSRWAVEITTYDQRTMKWVAKDRPEAEQMAFQMIAAQMGMVDLLAKFKDRHHVQVTFE